MKTENLTGHTPGPWRLRSYESNKDGPGRIHGVIMDKSEWDTLYICRFDNSCSANSKANAGLISAAPELLEVAEFLQSEWGNFLEKTNIKASFYSAREIQFMNELEIKFAAALAKIKEATE